MRARHRWVKVMAAGRAIVIWWQVWTLYRNNVMLAPLCPGANMRGLWCWLFHREWWVTGVVGYFDAECWCSRCEEYRFGPSASDADARPLRLERSEAHALEAASIMQDRPL